MADDNKPLKYLRYAIGEIVLVVIGILIALSINNWNNHQIEQKEEKHYLKRLVQDLKYDLNEIEAVVRSNQMRLYQCINALDTLGAQNISQSRMNFREWTSELKIDTSKVFIRSFGYGLTAIRLYDKYNNSDATYRELLASGKMDLIQNEELKISIIDYYSTLEDKLQVVRFVETMRNNYVKLLAEKGISMYNEMSYKELDGFLSDKRSLIAEIENIFFVTITSQLTLKYGGRQTLEQSTKELILKIEDFLD